jgi:hypothetical protein
MKFKLFSAVYIWVLTLVGSVALIAYLRILLFYNNGHVVPSDTPIILLALALPTMASGIYGLVRKKSFAKQPILLRSAVLMGILIFIATSLFHVGAMYAIGQAFQGNSF